MAWPKDASGNPAGRNASWEPKKGYSSCEPDEPCPVCGVVIADHARCRACRILVGYGHERSADGLCDGCNTQRKRSRQGAAQVAAAIQENARWGL